MKLSAEDKTLLIQLGAKGDEFDQIEETLNGCVFEYGIGVYKSRRIGRTKAIDLLGWKVFLSGILRCAFHMTASREIDNTKQYVMFDNSKLWHKWMNE